MNELFEPEENYKTGWVKIFRSIRNHWIWQDERKLKWWIDILLEVNHVGKQVPIGYKIFECKKGECLISLQNWAIRWNVSKSVVNNFFTMLVNDGMIEIKNETVTTRLIVCNYESYQDNQNAFKTQQERKKTEQSTTKNEKNEKNINTSVFIYSEFYDAEILKSENDSRYLFFVKFIFGKNETGEKLSGLLSIPKQLSFDNFNQLIEKAKLNGMKLMDIVLKIENDKKYWKGKKSLYLTINNWIDNRFIK